MRDDLPSTKQQSDNWNEFINGFSSNRLTLLEPLTISQLVECAAEITKLYLLNFHVMSPNATQYTTKFNKKILMSKTEAVIWLKSTGLQGWKWITVRQFWFRDRRSRNQNFRSGGTLRFLVDTLFRSLIFFFTVITFGDIFFLFQDDKVSLRQVPGDNHENTVFSRNTGSWDSGVRFFSAVGCMFFSQGRNASIAYILYQVYEMWSQFYLSLVSKRRRYHCNASLLPFALNHVVLILKI